MSIPKAGEGYVLAKDQGDLYWFLDTLMEVKAGAEQTRGAFTVIEWAANAGFAPPPHIHRSEDESFYVIDGVLTVACDQQQWRAEPGAFVFLPRGRSHTFTVEQPVRALQITTPAAFEKFCAEVGRPATSATVPQATAPDIPQLLEAAGKYEIEILLPR
jgi:quercetin dioxygenase-like cupin family protein